MPVSTPCYCTREDVMLALDFHPTARTITLVDRAIQSAANSIYGACHRRFWPEDATRYFDWPNYQYAYPWRIWFEQYDLVAATSVTSGGVAIPLGQIFFEPADKQPDEPFTYMELDRSTTASFGQGPTPQRDVAITGAWGYTALAAPAGQLAAAVPDATSAAVTVSDGSQMGVGDLIAIGTERMLVCDRAMASTGVAFTGPATANASDNLIGVPDVSQFGYGETLLLDAERMYVTDKTATALVVKRAWDGTVLAAHTTGTIYASRLLTVARGATGTTAAAHTSGTAVARHVCPPLISEWSLALAENAVLQATSGYARTIGEGATARMAGGGGLADIAARAVARYGRKARTGVI